MKPAARTVRGGVRLQPLTRARVASLGEPGRLWAESLPRVLAELAEQWSLTLGRALPGGSASYVVRATTVDGEERVVKVLAPDPEHAGEVRTLVAAGGRGYALLHAHDPVRQALLLESLGPSLEQTPLPPEEKLAHLADTLLEAWRLPLDAAPALAPGADRAASLHRSISELDASLDHPGSRAAVAQALAYAGSLAASYDPGACVVVHGDAHPANALRAPDRPGAGSGWVFVDPDGCRAEAAYDLGVVVRDWTGQLAGDDPRGVIEGYCSLLASRTGLDEQRIWEWGFVERVSTGLYVLGFDADVIGRRFLASADRLLAPRG